MDARNVAEGTWRAALSALLDGEEPPVSMAELMEHLAGCESCSQWLDQAVVVNVGLRDLPMVLPSLGERVVNSVDVRLCACRSGGVCLCNDCQCGATCTCQKEIDPAVGSADGR